MGLLVLLVAALVVVLVLIKGMVVLGVGAGIYHALTRGTDPEEPAIGASE